MAGPLTAAFELGPIALIGPEPRLGRVSRDLPRHWEIHHYESLDEVAEAIRGGTVGVVVVVVDGISVDELQAYALRLPLERPEVGVVVAPSEQTTGIEGLSEMPVQNVYLPGDSQRELIEAILDARVNAFFQPLAAEIEAAEHLSVWIRRLLGRMCLQRPLPSPQAKERLRRGKTVFVRTVRDWAERIGASESFIYREAKRSGVRLSLAIRWITSLRGLALYHPPETRWAEVACRLGFADSSDFARSVRTTIRRSPGEAVGDGFEYWLGAFRYRLSEGFAA